MTSQRYLVVVFVVCAAVVVPLGGLNLILGKHALGTVETTKLASDWQNATQGVTYAPPIASNRAFKSLRLHDRLGDVNAVVFGSSTVLGLAADSFPEGVRAYNFSHFGNSTASSLAEAEYISLNHANSVSWLFMALDWSIGFLFEKRQSVWINLSPDAVLSVLATREISFFQQLSDAVSYPKVAILGTVLRDVWRARDSSRAFQSYFLNRTTEEYRCLDGTRAMDFDVLYRGKCEGFYFDGSTRFPLRKRISARELEGKLAAASHPNSYYAKALRVTDGRPNGEFLDRLARIGSNVKAAGGNVILMLPPLLPGLEQRLSATPHSADRLMLFKELLAKWAVREQIVIVDAGRSERYGCLPTEFVDEHHATKDCFDKMLKRFWTVYRSDMAPGMYEISRAF